MSWKPKLTDSNQTLYLAIAVRLAVTAPSSDEELKKALKILKGILSNL
ncbi:hypothetical protein N4T77_01665 [Clostridium sp. CX1]|uniref:Uncharacterized protein n=1 Tax=Clostridium tanneri TaxID=3037988 RepID=A0ABU4JQ20_9CLOT|nr:MULTISPECIES: hypothetical protein [unclassified Clostridium]MCT8975296.1 hypothetical protein [Clostridium sp. CX1]MDW8800220.1 hypothetical protein [Clostridium sp. A1-XYC3]